MAFERPSIQDLISRVQSDAESRLGKKAMRWTLVPVLSRVIAGVSHTLHGHINFVLRQIFASTAEGAYLERRASEYAIYRKTASYATGTVSFVGTGVVPEGSQLQTGDGAIYITTADSLKGSAPIKAAVAGSSGNADGLTLTLVSPVEGVQSTCISGVLTGGADAEDDESLRERLLYRQKTPPRAGTKEDYVKWAFEVPGVTRAWCFPKEEGIGHVTVRFMTDAMTSNGVPNSTMIEAVKKHISDEMPVTAVLHVVAPVPKPLDLTIDVVPDTERIRKKVESAIASAIYVEAAPSGSVLYSALDRAVAGIPEIISYRITSPSSDATCGKGEIFVPGRINFV